MIYRILPLIGVLAIAALFVFVIVMKRRKTLFLEWNKKTSIILAATLLTLHIGFACYYAFYQGVYLYLLHTDLCTMLYPQVTIALLLNAKRILRVLYPLAIVGGLFELMSQKMTFESDVAFEEITSFVKHLLLLVIGIYIMINQVDYKWKFFWLSVLWLVTFMLYIIMIEGIPYWVTGDKRFGAFSMGLIPSSYEEVNVSWTKVHISAEYGVLKGWGYPFGTIALMLVASLIGSAFALAGVITSKYQVERSIKFTSLILKTNN